MFKSKMYFWESLMMAFVELVFTRHPGSRHHSLFGIPLYKSIFFNTSALSR